MIMKSAKIYPWILVALLWGVALLNYMDRQMLATMKEAMQVDIVELRSATNFGRLMAVFLWIYGFLSPVAGLIADRFSRKWLIVGSLFVWSAVTLAMGYVHNYHFLLVLRALMGVSEALYIPAGLSLIADWHDMKSRSLAIGLHMTGLYTGQAIGGFGATLAATWSWHATFHWFGLVGIIYALLLSFCLKDKKSDNESAVKSVSISPFSGISSLIRNTSFWVILFFFAASGLPSWATKNWLPTLFADSLNIPMAQAGPFSTISIAVSSFIGVVLGGILSDKWVQKVLRGRIYTSAIGLFLTIPSLLLLGFGQGYLCIIGAAVCFGLGFGMFDANNMPILCQFVSAKQRATAYGVMNMVGVFGGAFITELLGKWTDAGNLGIGFAGLSGIILVALLIQLYCLRPRTQDMIE